MIESLSLLKWLYEVIVFVGIICVFNREDIPPSFHLSNDFLSGIVD